jgi:hypothetical protein
MKMTIRWNRFASCTFLSLTWMLCLQSIDIGWAQVKTGDAVGANAQAEDLLDLRGDLPNPRRIDASELHKLPRVEALTADPHDPGKEIIYSGTPLVEVLKAGGLLLDSDMAGIRETVTMTVLVEATDGYRAVFSLAELDSELTDRVILLADTKDGQPLPPREGHSASSFRRETPGALGAPSQGGDSSQELKAVAGSPGRCDVASASWRGFPFCHLVARACFVFTLALDFHSSLFILAHAAPLVRRKGRDR